MRVVLHCHTYIYTYIYIYISTLCMVNASIYINTCFVDLLEILDMVLFYICLHVDTSLDSVSVPGSVSASLGFVREIRL